MIKFSFSGNCYQTQRVIGRQSGSPGPTIVFFGGIHGNEPSGVIALQQVFAELESNQIPMQGQVIGLAGNLPGLASNQRFISRDLNRIWDDDFSTQFRDHNDSNNGRPKPEHMDRDPEFNEQCELFEIIEPLLTDDNPVFFIDLHTTSSSSSPFIAINDQLDNRRFALQFPVPTVLGIEEHIEGPLLSYLNDFGRVAMGFEAGQHEDPEAVKIHGSFVRLAMLAAGIIQESDVPNLKQHQARLAQNGRAKHEFFEVVLRKAINRSDDFKMEPGFENFHVIDKGELLARDRHGPIPSPRKGRIFMPLYQDSGDDGFFIVRKIPTWALKLSSGLRKINFEHVLVWLPGISRSPEQPDALVVNKHVARFLANQIFHLLGYRRKHDDGHAMIFSRREIKRK